MKFAPEKALRAAWLRFVMPLLAGLLLLDALGAWAQLEGQAPRLLALLQVLGWLGLLAWAGWAGNRAWVHVHRYLQHGGPRRPARAAQSGIVIAGLAALGAFAGVVLPQLGDWAAELAGQDPEGQVTVQMAADGRSARLSGHLGLGDGARVVQALGAAPQLYLLELGLTGANWHEARGLAAWLGQRGLQTRLVSPCNGACAPLYLAGSARQVLPQQGLGLHRFEVASANPLMHLLARRWSAAQYRALGLGDYLVFGAVGSAPATPWLVDGVELTQHGLAGQPQRPLDVAPPLRAGAQLAEYRLALQCNPAWGLLDQRRPGLIEQAAQSMFDAHQAGAAEAAVQLAAQRAIEPLLQALLHDAPFALHEPYAALLSDQLAAAAPAGQAVCRGLLAGDAMARRSLPADLQARETAWLLEAAREVPAGKRPLSPLENEVMRRALGQRAVAVLGSLRSAPGAEACERPRALLAEIGKLPPGERRLAMRLLFERP